MKKFNFAKIVSLVFVCAMLLCALAVTALAQDETTVEIVSNNVYFGEKYQLMYAVNAPANAKVSATVNGKAVDVVLFKTNPTDEQNNVVADYAYILAEGVAAQAIDTVVTFTVEADGKTATSNYSVLQYVYERMYVKNIAEGKELAMFEAFLAFADAANANFTDGETVSFNDYKYVTVVDGTLDGNNTAGMFALNSTPFENIEATLEYDNTTHNVEWDVTVGDTTKHYTDDEIKALAVTGNMTVTAVLVKSECIHEWSEATCDTLSTCSKCGETTGDYAEHTWSGWTVNEATCSEKGEEFRICDICKKKESNPIDINPDNHVFVDGKCACGAVQTTVTVNIGEYATANSWANGTKYDTVMMNNNITVTATGSSYTGKYYSNGNDWRIYQNENPAVTVTAKTGNIISVKVTYTVSNTGVLTLNGTNIASGDVVTVNAKSVEFSVGNTGTATNGNVKITEIEVVYGVAAHECDYSEATCTTLATCTICGETKGELADHSWVDATCVAPKTCSVCLEIEGDALGHTDENPADHTCDVCTVTNISACIDKDADNACDICGEDMGSGEEPEQPSEPSILATFELGDDGAASHKDGDTATTYTETVNEYTLNVTNGTKFYTGAIDAKGNSAFKLGTSSVAGSFSFTVGADVDKVVIYVAAYKAKTATVTINGVETALTTKSDNGEYTAIEIDTTTNKTVSFAVTSGYRCMVNTIEFWG